MVPIHILEVVLPHSFHCTKDCSCVANKAFLVGTVSDCDALTRLTCSFEASGEYRTSHMTGTSNKCNLSYPRLGVHHCGRQLSLGDGTLSFKASACNSAESYCRVNQAFLDPGFLTAQGAGLLKKYYGQISSSIQQSSYICPVSPRQANTK